MMMLNNIEIEQTNNLENIPQRTYTPFNPEPESLELPKISFEVNGVTFVLDEFSKRVPTVAEIKLAHSIIQSWNDVIKNQIISVSPSQGVSFTRSLPHPDQGRFIYNFKII